MVPLGESVKDEVPSDKPQPTERSNTENVVFQEISITGISSLQSDKQGNLKGIETKNLESVPDSAVDALILNQQRKASPTIHEKASKSPETGGLALHSGQEVSTPTIVREKVSEDGYNWRKYGQKLVKGNEYVRSYYRCTHPNCLVKKQLERSHEGKIVDIIHFGQHDHPKPQLSVPVAVGFVVSIVEEKRSESPSFTTAEGTSVDEHRKPPTQTEHADTPQTPNIAANDRSKATLSHSSKIKDEVYIDDDPDSKRQKKDKHHLETTTVDKPTTTSEPRLVVQTLSEVDIVNDGYRWRKYGQKMVKGNPNPRSYYRCSNSGCPVKKHVERASHDTKVVIATYEGQHNHDVPPGRIVTHNVSGSTVSPTAHHGDTAAKSDGNAASLDMVVDAILEHESKPKEQLNGELRTRSAPKNLTNSDMVIESRPSPDNRSDKQQNGKSGVKEEIDFPENVPVETSKGNSPSLTSRTNDKQNVDSDASHGNGGS